MEHTPRHRPRVRRHYDELFSNLTAYRAECTCGFRGERHGAKLLADTERQDHIEALGTPPEHERCRDPKRHRTPGWEPCPLCAHQLALPGL